MDIVERLTWIEGICGLGGWFIFMAGFPIGGMYGGGIGWYVIGLGLVLMAVGECANQEWKKRTGRTRDY
jgi:hypothetical protein